MFRDKIADVSVEVENLFKNTINKMGDKELKALFQGDNLDAFIQKHKIADANFLEWLKTVDESTFTFENYQNWLIKNGKQTTTWASITKKAGAIAKSFSAALGSMAINAAIGIVISKIEQLIVTQEELKEKAEEALSSYQDSQNTLKANKQTIDEISEDYERLSSGVDRFGNNISLNTEEYARYNEIVNKIADMFPQMVQGYTDEGNAIIAHKGNVEELTKAYEDQKKAAEDALIISGSDVFENFKKTTSDNIQLFNSGNALLAQKDVLENILNNGGVTASELDDTTISNAIESAGIKLSLWDAINPFEDSNDDNVELVNSSLDKIAARVRQLTRELNAETEKVKPVLDAYIQSDPDYGKLDENTKEIADRIIGGLSADYIASADSDIDLYSKVVDDIIDPLKDADLSREFNTIFDLQTQFNNNEITVGEYQEKLNAFLPLIENLDPEVKKSILLLFGIETNDDGTTTSDTDTMINNVKDKLQDKFDDKVGELTMGDLEIAVNDIEVPEGTLLSWDELIAKIKEVKDLNAKESGVLLTDLKDTADNLSLLQTVLNEMNDEGNVSINTLTSLQEKFSNVSGIDDYINRLSEVKSGSKEFQNILTELTYAYLENQFSAEELANTDESLLATMLRSAGIANADELATFAVARAKEELRIQTALAEATSADAVLALMREAEQCGITEQKFMDLVLTTGIFNNQNLDTQQKIDALIELGYYAQWTREQLEGIATVKRIKVDGRDVIAAYDDQGHLITVEDVKQYSDTSSKAPTPIYRSDASSKSAAKDAQQRREKEAQLEEAWEQERLEQLKDNLEKRKNELEQYKSDIETLDFGLDILDESNYSGRIDLLSQKYSTLVTYGQQLRQEFERVSQIVPNTAAEAQEIASRVQELGSEMRSNLKTLRETVVETQKMRINLVRSATVDVFSDLSSQVDESREFFDSLDNPYIRNSDDDPAFLSEIDGLYEHASELEKQLEEKKDYDEALIEQEQETQDTINEIVTNALEMQAKENAEARAEERAKLEKELDEISSEYKSTLDEASANTAQTQQKISGEFDTVSDSAETMQNNVDTHFSNMETSVTNHVDGIIKKVDELKDKLDSFNPFSFNSNDSNNSNNSNSSDYSAIGGAVAPSYTRVSSPYGMRKHPIYGTTKHHAGIDFAAPGGSDIKAAASGTVSLAGWNGGYGNCVIITHEDGTQTLYGHASKLLVSKGDQVTKGQVIAKVGKTGNSTGNHLHFETRMNGEDYDPTVWFSTHAKGTKDYGIAGENNKREYAINKKTGEWSAIDSPTLFDKSKYDIVGEKVSEKIDKPIPTFATGTPMTNQQWLKYVKEACDAFGVPYNVALSLIDQESANGTASDTWSYNSAGAYGLTQITKSAIDDLKEDTAVTNNIRKILEENGIDLDSARGGGIEHARDNIWVGIGNLAEIKDRYMYGNDPDWSKSLGYYYAGGNYAGKSGTWYANQVLDRANSEAFLKAADSLAESIDSNTEALEEKEDTNPYSDENIDKTLEDYIKANIDPLREENDEWDKARSNAIEAARKAGELSPIEYQQEQEKYYKDKKDKSGAFGDESVKLLKSLLKDMESSGLPVSQEAFDTVIDAIDEFGTEAEELNDEIETALYDIDKEIEELRADNNQKWWNLNIWGYNRESVERQKRVDELLEMESMTDDPVAKAILQNRRYQEAQDTIDYVQASQKAMGKERDEIIGKLNSALDMNGLNFDIESWFNPDGSLNEQFEFDMKDIAYYYGEHVETELRGMAEGIETYNQALSENIELSKQAQQTMYEIDQQRIDNFVSSMQHGIELYTEMIDKQKEALNEEITYYNSLSTLLSKHHSVVNSISEAHHSINKELQASQTMYKYLDDQTRRLLFNEEDYVALTRELNDIQSRANRLRSQYEYDLAHASAEEIAEITNNYERQYDLLMKSYEIAKANLEVEKKRTQLNNVLNERNVRMFINGQWQWVANTQDVISAQNELADAEYSLSQAETQQSQTMESNKLGAASDSLNTQINYLDTQVQKINEDWERITDIIEGKALTISQAWADIATTDSGYLKNIIHDIAGGFEPLYRILTGNGLPPLDQYASYDRSIEPGSGYESEYVTFEPNANYERDFVTDDGFLASQGYVPAWKQASLRNEISVPKSNKTSNVTNIDNSVTINGMKVTGEDGTTIYETTRRYAGIH